MKEFKVKVTLINGKYASRCNMSRIIAVSSEVCKNVIHPAIDNSTYKEKWVIKREKQGYIFREVTHGGGIGIYKTIKECVMAACKFSHIKVIFEPQPPVSTGD